MGIFDFLFKKNRHEGDKISTINKSLHNSFSNVKKDILHLHKTIKEKDDETNQRFQLIEERIKKMEGLFFSKLTQKESFMQKIKEQPREEKSDIEYDDSFLNALKSFQRTEIRMFKTIYELQTNLHLKHISYKSLASYVYPNKNYGSIRSAITQFLARLHTEGLVDKKRVGKEAYVTLTPQGYRVIKNAKIKKFIESLQLIEEED